MRPSPIDSGGARFGTSAALTVESTGDCQLAIKIRGVAEPTFGQ
jgi:hypothetical protein